MKARGLGRGLGALLPELPSEDGERVAMLPMGDIDPNPAQPRRRFDPTALQELADSIRQVGVLQPILVCEMGGRYRIIAGERRWRAARMAKLETIPAIVRRMDDVARMEAALIENIQREDLNPVEEAAGHARALAAIEDVRLCEALAQRAAQEGWSVRQMEQAAQESRKKREEKSRPARRQTPEFSALEERLREAFGMRAQVAGTLEKGRITLQYTSREALERLYEAIGGQDE